MCRTLLTLFGLTLIFAPLTSPAMAESIATTSFHFTPAVDGSHFSPAGPLLQFPQAVAPGEETTLFGLPLNMGPWDRSLRAVIAAGLIGTGIYGLSTGHISPVTSGVLLGVAAIPTLTAATGYCPLYQVFGLQYSF